MNDSLLACIISDGIQILLDFEKPNRDGADQFPIIHDENLSFGGDFYSVFGRYFTYIIDDSVLIPEINKMLIEFWRNWPRRLSEIEALRKEIEQLPDLSEIPENRELETSFARETGPIVERNDRYSDDHGALRRLVSGQDWVILTAINNLEALLEECGITGPESVTEEALQLFFMRLERMAEITVNYIFLDIARHLYDRIEFNGENGEAVDVAPLLKTRLDDLMQRAAVKLYADGKVDQRDFALVEKWRAEGGYAIVNQDVPFWLKPDVA